MRLTFPFGRLRRSGSQGLEIVEIQLAKYHRPAFRLNLGIAPPGGITHPVGGQVAQDEVWVHYLDHSYELLECPWLWKWFSVWRFPGKAATRAECEKLVDKVVKLVPEIEALFAEGKQGPHMRERSMK